MCNFFSALVLRNGDVLHHPMLDSHSDLVTYFKLPDETAHHQHFAKIELVPVDWLDAATWRFQLDAETAPGWWTEVAQAAEEACRAIVAKMMLRSGEHRLVVDGCWIVGGTAIVRDVRAGRIVQVRDSAQIHDVRGSAQIHDVWGSAQIHDVGDSAQIHDVRGSAQIRGVRGSAQIRGVGDSAQIHDVRDSAQIHDVWDSAQIHDVRGSAQIHDVWGSAQIHDVGGSAQLDLSARAHVVTTP